MQYLYMTIIFMFYLYKIICLLNTFLKFLSFVYMTFKVKYLTQSYWVS